MHVDFAKVKNVPIASVLRMRGIDLKRSGEFLIGNCPLPSHKSSKSNTFKVNITENWWTCFSDSCRSQFGKKGGDVIDLVRALERVESLPAAQRIAEEFCLPETPAPPQTPEITTDRNRPLKWNLQAVNPCHEMIQSRGISVETATSWGVGFYRSKQRTASMDDRIVFPLYEDGNLVGYAGRTTLQVTDSNPKWKFGKGVRKSFLYGLERACVGRPIILLESCWGPLWFGERGQQAAAMMGDSLTEEQEERLKPFTTVVVAMDNDEKGKQAAREIADRLKTNHTVIRSFLRE